MLKKCSDLWGSGRSAGGWFWFYYIWSLGKYITCCITAGLARGRALPDKTCLTCKADNQYSSWLTCRSCFDLSPNACRDMSSYIVHAQKQQQKTVGMALSIERDGALFSSWSTSLKGGWGARQHSGIKWIHSHTYWVLVLHLLRSLGGHNILCNLWEEKKKHNAHCCCRKR